MPSRLHKRDKTHKELIGALRNRCAGYWRDENGAHHAHLNGLQIDAYDMHKAGSGFPDWIVFVSWLAICIEIKNKEGRRASITHKGFYTPAEETFMQGFHGLRFTAFEQNEIFDLLRKAARFVLAVDDMLSGYEKPEPLPQEFVELFFPRATLLAIGKSPLNFRAALETIEEVLRNDAKSNDQANPRRDPGAYPDGR